MFKDTKAFCSFSVNDQKKAKAFYTQVLGLDVSEPMGELQLNLPGGAKIFVYEKPDHSPASFTVLNFPVDSVERTVAALKERGVKFETYDKGDIKTDEKGISRGFGMAIAWFKDPAGNVMSVLEEKK